MMARMIVAGAAGHAAHLHWEEASALTNAQIRSKFDGMFLVCVEAESQSPRHADLLPGDAVMTIAGNHPNIDVAHPATTAPATSQQGVCDAA